MKILNFFVAFIVLYLLILPRNAYAYLDPGTGSYLLQIIGAVLFTGLFFMNNWWKKIIEFLKKIFSKGNNEEEQPKNSKTKKS